MVITMHVILRNWQLVPYMHLHDSTCSKTGITWNMIVYCGFDGRYCSRGLTIFNAGWTYRYKQYNSIFEKVCCDLEDML